MSDGVHNELFRREKYKEIADELGISVNTVKSHVMKAYRDIRARVGGEQSPVLLFIALQG
ncbi:MAG: sigma factor-like helix-turn-helix DNA-binding protein [Butyricimonas faecihominis]